MSSQVAVAPTYRYMNSEAAWPAIVLFSGQSTAAKRTGKLPTTNVSPSLTRVIVPEMISRLALVEFLEGVDCAGCACGLWQ